MVVFNFINLFILSMVFFLLTDAHTINVKLFKKSDAKYNVMKIRGRILALSKDSNAWSSIVADTCNTSLACQRSGAKEDCFSSHSKPNEWTDDKVLQCIYDFGGKEIYFDYNNITAGFDIHGEKCFTYDHLSPDGKCVFRPYVQWRSTCTKSPCKNEHIEFRIQVYQSGLGVPLNTANLAVIWGR